MSPIASFLFDFHKKDKNALEVAIRAAIENKMQGKRLAAKINNYRQWTHVQTYGTHVFAMDMLSSISQAGIDKPMKPLAFYCVFILVLRRLLN